MPPPSLIVTPSLFLIYAQGWFWLCPCGCKNLRFFSPGMQHFGTNESDHHSARKRWKSAAAIAFACALIAVLQTTSLQSLWAAGVHIPVSLTSKVLALSVSGYPGRDAGGHPVVHCPPFTSPPIPVCGAIVAPNRSTHQGTHNRTISYYVDRQPSCPAKWRCRVPPKI